MGAWTSRIRHAIKSTALTIFPLKRHRVDMRRVVVAAPLLVLILGASALAQDFKRIIDNERVTVWDTPNVLPPAEHDFVAVSLKGTAVFGHKGDVAGEAGARTIVVALKDHPAAPIVNNSGYPNAYPREGIVKLLENDRVIVWSYRWTPGKPTVMHFHNTDVVVVYQEDTPLESITPDGKSVLNEYKFADVRFNRGNRIHSEVLVGNSGSAVITELK
jgi:hypothetical protein